MPSRFGGGSGNRFKRGKRGAGGGRPGFKPGAPARRVERPAFGPESAGSPSQRPSMPTGHRSSDPSFEPRTDLVYGRRPVFEVFQAGKRAVHKLWVVQGTHGGIVEEIITWARERGVPLEWTKWEWLDKIVQAHHQGVAAQVSATEYLELEDFLAKLSPQASATLLACDEIQDPQNLGAMLRSAAFFGVSAAITPRWRSAPVGEAAMRASSGAIEHLPLIRVRNLSDALLLLKEAGFEILGADMEGVPAWSHRPGQRSVLVMGNEGEGLRRLVKERCDKLVAIPRRGALDSLNVAAATAIFLYELSRGRPKPA